MKKEDENDRVQLASETERRNKIAEILAEGVYSYLKKNGFLKGDFGREGRIVQLLEKTKKVGTQFDDSDFEEFLVND